MTVLSAPSHVIAVCAGGATATASPSASSDTSSDDLACSENFSTLALHTASDTWQSRKALAKSSQNHYPMLDTPPRAATALSNALKPVPVEKLKFGYAAGYADMSPVRIATLSAVMEPSCEIALHVARLAAGSFSKVRLACHISDATELKVLALKEIRREKAPLLATTSTAHKQRLTSEVSDHVYASEYGKLNLLYKQVMPLAWWQSPKNNYIAMPLFDGDGYDFLIFLHDTFRHQRSTWAYTQLLCFVWSLHGLSEVLQRAHALQFAILDHSLANLMLDRRYGALIVDLSWARRFTYLQDLAHMRQPRLTATPGFSAPEMYFDDLIYPGAATDVWGVGVILSALLVPSYVCKNPFLSAFPGLAQRHLKTSDDFYSWECRQLRAYCTWYTNLVHQPNGLLDVDKLLSPKLHCTLRGMPASDAGATLHMLATQKFDQLDKVERFGVFFTCMSRLSAVHRSITTTLLNDVLVPQPAQRCSSSELVQWSTRLQHEHPALTKDAGKTMRKLLEDFTATNKHRQHVQCALLNSIFCGLAKPT